MSFVKIRSWVAGLLVLALVGCGGGGSGDAGTPLLSDGGTSGGGTGTASPTVTVALSSPTITPANAAVVTVTVRDAKGAPIAGRVVDLSMDRGGLAKLSVASAATDSSGVATAALYALTSGASGADDIVATVNLDPTTITGRAAFTVAGNAPVISMSATSTTLSAAAGPVTIRAEIRDAAGNSVANTPVSFTTSSGRVTLGAPSALTNSVGIASVLASPTTAGQASAETILASATVSGQALQSVLPVQVVADTPSLSILASVSTVSAASPATLTISVKNASNQPVSAGTIVSLKSTFGLSSFDAATVATNASGIAQVRVSPLTASSNGADQIVASATVGGVAISAPVVLNVAASAGGASTLTVALSSSTITSTTAAVVTVNLRDAQGNPLSGKVVDLKTGRGGLAALSRISLATDADGSASAILSKVGGGAFGADELIATAVLDGVTFQSTAAFTVNGSVPTIQLALSPASNILQVSAGKSTLTATVLGLTGQPVSGVPVRFTALSDLVTLDARSVVTDANGQATTKVLPTDASLNSAETLTASVTVAGLAAESSLPVQLVGDQPSIVITPSNSNVSAGQPSTIRVRVLDTHGTEVSGAVVTVAGTYGLVSFNQTTSATNNTGTAEVVASPKSTSSNGAEVVVARVTVGGVTVSDSVVLRVSSAASSTPPDLQTALSSTSISSASPATVTATLRDGAGAPVAGQVVTFSVVRQLAKTNIATALTNSDGRAVVVLSPVSSTVAGADEVTATTDYAGVKLQSTSGFQIQATNVSLTNFTSAVARLGPYAQTTLTLTLAGASVGSPVNVSVTSACVSLGKATLSPASFSATTPTVTLQYKDVGCGALQSADKLQAAIVGASGAVALDLPIDAPSATSLAFVSASPEVIYIRGSGFTESSTLTFEVRDAAGNILPNRQVLLKLLTESGGVTLQGGVRPALGQPFEITQQSDAAGRVTVLVIAGTQPTPIRVAASLVGAPNIATVSSNLSVGVGLPSQLNFSMSQQALNIEGLNIDGTVNTYTIIAADRSGNPVPEGTSINFVTEGGQVEAIRRTAMVNGIARTTAQFVSASPRPEDGRVTVTAYALGEESFIDQNGNNVYDIGEPFQDLGNVHKDRNYDGQYLASVDEFVPTDIDNKLACRAPSASGTGSTIDTNALLALNPSIPSMAGGTCDNVWSGAGKVYVRRAVPTVLSTSAARMLWADTSILPSTCSKIRLQTGTSPTATALFVPVAQNGVVQMGGSGTLSFLVADSNGYDPASPFAAGGAVGRFNPVAAGSVVTAVTPTVGLSVSVVGGGTVPSTSEASIATIAVGFDTTNRGVVSLTVRSPSGVATSFALNVSNDPRPVPACVP